MFLIVLILAVLIIKYGVFSCEECSWCVVDNNQYEEEFKDFLETVYKTQSFLQVGACFVEAKGFIKSKFP